MGVLRRVSHFFGMGREMTTIAAGKKAPNFSLKGSDGKEYSLEELLKKGPVFAAFFKASCPVCQFTFPFLERLYKQFGGDGVTFLGVSQDDARATKDFARQYGITFPMVMDEKGYPASNAYGLTMVPTVFLIDTDGTAKVSSMGFNKYDLEKIASELADRKHIPRAALFQPNESVPANRPG
jgi:peroxiredoxin